MNPAGLFNSGFALYVTAAYVRVEIEGIEARSRANMLNEQEAEHLLTVFETII